MKLHVIGLAGIGGWLVLAFLISLLSAAPEHLLPRAALLWWVVVLTGWLSLPWVTDHTQLNGAAVPESPNHAKATAANVLFYLFAALVVGCLIVLTFAAFLVFWHLLKPALEAALAVPYLATPIYCAAWIVRQTRLKAETWQGYSCLAVWLVITGSLVTYFFTVPWYREGTPLGTNIAWGLAFFALFVAFPIASMVFLRKTAARSIPEDSTKINRRN